MTPFAFLEPTTIPEACAMLSRYPAEARLIAGGTDLLVAIKKRESAPKYVVDLKQVPDLNRLESSANGGVTIGATAVIRDVERSPLVRDRFPILSDTAGKIALPAIRNMATVGGNLCNASPAADSAPALIALGAQARITGPENDRVVPLEDFFLGPGRTVLNPDEVLTRIDVPPPRPRTSGVYLKLQRTAVDIAVVGVAVLVVQGPEAGAVDSIRIVLGGVAPTPLRAREAERIAREGGMGEKSWVEAVAETCAREARPITDVRASADYRRQMVKALVRQGMTKVLSP